MTEDVGDPPLRIAEFGFPGELRDRLVGAILTGEKTATTGLVIEWQLDGEPLPRGGERFVVVDSTEAPVAVIEVRDVQVVPLAEVGLAVARDEGEGFASVREWRLAHEAYWNGYAGELRARLADPSWALGDDTPIVVQRFRLIRRIA